jgi:LemA protein
MSTGQILTLALAAVLVFWMLGAYNRLVRLRKAIGVAWAQVETPLRQRGEVVAGLIDELREPLAVELATLDAASEALRTAETAARALRSAPVSADAAADLSAAWARLDTGLARIVALCELSPALPGRAGVSQALKRLDASQADLVFGRQLFNAAVQSYNTAIDEFPTRLLVGLYRFGAAGRL